MNKFYTIIFTLKSGKKAVVGRDFPYRTAGELMQALLMNKNYITIEDDNTAVTVFLSEVAAIEIE